MNTRLLLFPDAKRGKIFIRKNVKYHETLAAENKRKTDNTWLNLLSDVYVFPFNKRNKKKLLTGSRAHSLRKKVKISSSSLWITEKLLMGKWWALMIN